MDPVCETRNLVPSWGYKFQSWVQIAAHHTHQKSKKTLHINMLALGICIN